MNTLLRSPPFWALCFISAFCALFLGYDQIATIFTPLADLNGYKQNLGTIMTPPPKVVGKMIAVEGSVLGIAESDLIQPLAVGSLIYEQETIQVAVDARAQIQLGDGSLINLIPDSEYVVDVFRHGQIFRKSRCKSSLFKGGLRLLSGSIGSTDPEDYQVQTPDATIGLRGTLFDARLDNGLLVSVDSGAVRVSGPHGFVDVDQGQTGHIIAGEAPHVFSRRPESMNPLLFSAPRGGKSLVSRPKGGLFHPSTTPPRRERVTPRHPQAGGGGRTEGRAHEEVHHGGEVHHGEETHHGGMGGTAGGGGAHGAGGHGEGTTGGTAGGHSGGFGSPGR